MAREDADQRPAEERLIGGEPGYRLPDDELYPIIEDPLRDLQGFIKPLGPSTAKILEDGLEAARSGELTLFEYDGTQKSDGFEGGLHVKAERPTDGSTVRIRAQGLIYGEPIQRGGDEVKTSMSGIWHFHRTEDDVESGAKEGVDYPNPTQVLGYIANPKLPLPQPVIIPEARRLYPHGFRIVAFDVVEGQDVLKSKENPTILCRIERLEPPKA